MKTTIIALAFASFGIMSSQAVSTLNWDFGTLNIAGTGAIPDGRAVYLFASTTGAVVDTAALQTSLVGLTLSAGTVIGGDWLILGSGFVDSSAYSIPGTGNSVAANIFYNNNLSSGDDLGILWFDQTPGAIQNGVKFGTYLSSANEMPADGSNVSVSFLTVENGGPVPNGITTTLTTVPIPEPSAALLGALGALGLLRRRRI